MLKTLIAAALIAAPLAAVAAPAPALALHFANVQSKGSRIMIAIFKDAPSWNGGAPVRVAMLEAGKGNSVSVEGLAPGRYAVKVFHDVDGDGKMGMNPFGIPTEPFGFSRDAMGERGAPAWEDAAFEVTAAGTAQTITLR